MRVERDLPTATADADYVLGVLRDEHRFACDHDPEADPTIWLDHDTSVADWRVASDLLPWRPLGRALRESWRVHASGAEWSEVLEPANEVHLGDVCRFIASRTHRVPIRPIRIAGGACVTAGAFLTLRTLLHRRGVDVTHLRPSTPLSTVLRRDPWALVHTASRLRPGVVPTLHFEHSPIVSCLLALLGLAKPGRPVGVALGSLRTFRDLVEVLVAA